MEFNVNIKKPVFLSKLVRKWTYAPFENSARDDNMKLGHWVPNTKLEDYEYPFARLNKHVSLVQFTDDDYYRLMLDRDDWNLKETRHLFELCEQFDMKFNIVCDRYNSDSDFKYPERKVEDLKERYYYVDRCINKYINNISEEELCLEFDADHEKKRKAILNKFFNRTAEDILAEENLASEIKKISVRQKERNKLKADVENIVEFAEEVIAKQNGWKHNKNELLNESVTLFQSGVTTNNEKEILKISDESVPNNEVSRKRKKNQNKNVSTNDSVAPLLSQSIIPQSLTDINVKYKRIKFAEPFKHPGAYLRSQKFNNTHIVGLKRSKMLEQVCTDLGLMPNQIPTHEINKQLVVLRTEILILYDLKYSYGVSLYDLEILEKKLNNLENNQPIMADIDTSLNVKIENKLDSTFESLNKVASSEAAIKRRKKATRESEKVQKDLELPQKKHRTDLEDSKIDRNEVSNDTNAPENETIKQLL